MTIGWRRKVLLPVRYLKKQSSRLELISKVMTWDTGLYMNNPELACL